MVVQSYPNPGQMAPRIFPDVTGQTDPKDFCTGYEIEANRGTLAIMFIDQDGRKKGCILGTTDMKRLVMQILMELF